MSKKKKLNLKDLKVQSFVTSLASHQMHKINGAGFTDGNCDINPYTDTDCCLDPTDVSICSCQVVGCGGGGGGDTAEIQCGDNRSDETDC